MAESQPVESPLDALEEEIRFDDRTVDRAIRRAGWLLCELRHGFAWRKGTQK
jgi:hypothetical protein